MHFCLKKEKLCHREIIILIIATKKSKMIKKIKLKKRLVEGEGRKYVSQFESRLKITFEDSHFRRVFPGAFVGQVIKKIKKHKMV